MDESDGGEDNCGDRIVFGERGSGEEKTSDEELMLQEEEEVLSSVKDEQEELVYELSD